MKDFQIISSEIDYECALKELLSYFDNQPKLGTKDSERFKALLDLVEAYEEKAFPI
jgi:HTH-type transcriptional regulator/antitoxin HigA